MPNRNELSEIVVVPVVTTDVEALRLASLTSGKPLNSYVSEAVHANLVRQYHDPEDSQFRDFVAAQRAFLTSLLPTEEQ